MTRAARGRDVGGSRLQTMFMLAARYEGRPIVPIDEVCRDFFAHLTPEKLMRKVGNGEIPLPVVRVDALSQKSAKGVHLSDLADFLEDRAAAARKDLEAFLGKGRTS